MADLPFVSKADLEIFKALTLANDLSKKYSSNSMQMSSDVQTTSDDIFLSCNTDSQATSISASGSGYIDSQTTSTFASASDNFISPYSSFKFDSEYETVGRDVNCINVMCDSFIEKNNLLEKEIFSFLKDASSDLQEIISPKHLYQMLEWTNNTVQHIVLICDKMYKIQQVLQEKPYERTLKVNPSCQKAVLKFFTLANDIMDKLQRQVGNIENFRSETATGMETHHKELQSTLHKKILELAKRLDIISQFRDQLLPISTQNSNLTSKLDTLLS